MYKQWSPSVQQLVYQSFQMPRVRKNLFNLVVVADPTTAAGAEAMQVHRISCLMFAFFFTRGFAVAEPHVDRIGCRSEKCTVSCLECRLSSLSAAVFVVVVVLVANPIISAGGEAIQVRFVHVMLGITFRTNYFESATTHTHTNGPRPTGITRASTTTTARG